MSKEKEKRPGSVYTPLLVFLLLIAVFFVGRLSSQIEMMGSSGLGVIKGKMVESDKDDEEIDPMSVPGLKEMARSLSLNGDDFDSCLDEGKFEKRVEDDFAYGGEVGVSGTPSFFVNKVMVVGAQPLEIFEAVIDYELEDGSWDSPSESVAHLVDGNPNNGEVTLSDGVEVGVGQVRGDSDAKVKIVEFSDFECPFCQKTLPTLDKVFEKYGDQVSLEYRHYPLGFHSKAQKAAEAAECAGEQGKFWEMHDAIFESQT